MVLVHCISERVTKVNIFVTVNHYKLAYASYPKSLHACTVGNVLGAVDLISNGGWKIYP